MVTFMNFYENLKNYRLKNNFTQEDIANHLNLSRQTISKWEQGKSSPSIEDLTKLSQLYGISLDELVQSETTPPAKPMKKTTNNKWGLLLIAVILTFFILPIGGIIAIREMNARVVRETLIIKHQHIHIQN